MDSNIRATFRECAQQRRQKQRPGLWSLLSSGDAARTQFIFWIPGQRPIRSLDLRGAGETVLARGTKFPALPAGSRAHHVGLGRRLRYAAVLSGDCGANSVAAFWSTCDRVLWP